MTDKEGNVGPGPYPSWRPEQGAREANQQAAIQPKRIEQQLDEHQRVWNLVWWRRVIYFTTVLLSATIFVGAVWLIRVCWLGRGPDYFLVAVLPVLGVILRLFVLKSSSLQQNIGDLMRQIWMKRLGQRPSDVKPWPAPWPADSVKVFRLRTNAWYRKLFSSLRFCIIPTLFIWLPVLYVLPMGPHKLFIIGIGVPIFFACVWIIGHEREGRAKS